MQRKLNDEFIREYSEEFSEKITAEFFADKERISGKEILNVSPSKQVNFFILKILFRKWQEEMKRLESPFFNYRNPEVRKAMVQFMNTLSQHIEVSKDHFISMAEEAVADTLLLAIDPGSYISLEFEEMDVNKVTEKLTNPIFKYIKLHKSDIEEFFGSTNGLDLDDFVEQAQEFFADIETEATVQHQVDLLSKVLPLYFDDLYYQEEEPDEFDEQEDISSIEDSDMNDEDDSDEIAFDYPEDDELEDEEQIDQQVEEENDELTEDLRENEIKGEIESEAEDTEESHLAQEENDSFDEEEFDEDAEEVTEELEDLNATEDQETEIDHDQLEEEAVPEAEDEIDDNYSEYDDASSEKEDEQFVAGKVQEDDDVEEDPNSSLNQKYAEKAPTINDKFSGKEKETVANKHESKQVNNIMEAISVNHRYMFTKELFDGDREAFVDAIDKIDSRDSFDDAVEMLVQNYANKRSWDMNSDEVKELLKVIFRRFR